MYKVAVLTISDRCASGERQDETGKVVQSFVKDLPAQIVAYDVVADEAKEITTKLIQYCDISKVDVVLTNGGTGLGSRDVTPEATKDVIQKEVPGISEAMRYEGLKKTSRAMLSRGITGLRNKTLIINLPGSPQGAQESLEVILSVLPHAIAMMSDGDH